MSGDATLWHEVGTFAVKKKHARARERETLTGEFRAPKLACIFRIVSTYSLPKIRMMHGQFIAVCQ